MGNVGIHVTLNHGDLLGLYRLWVQGSEASDLPVSMTSSQWSSETLAAGMRAVATQPTGLLVKTDEDEALALEYQVT